MNIESIEKIADAVLYEGYVLYPYRASAVKNQQRWNFGGLFPKAYSETHKGSDACMMQTECLIEGEQPIVDIKIRFLQISIREVGQITSPQHESQQRAAPFGIETEGEPEYKVVDSIVVERKTIHTWQEAIERDVCLQSRSWAELAARPMSCEFSFPESRALEIYRDDGAVIVRRRERIDFSVEMSATAISDRLIRLRIVIRNTTSIDNPEIATRDEAAMYAMASTHTILACRDGEFVSLMDPVPEWSEFAAQCQNIGAWPVLVGEEPQRGFMLASPIILYDYPQIAPESAGDLCDGLEIDEILTLRIMSLTDEEKQEMRSLDDRTRAILERTENLTPDQLAKLHGVVRGLRLAQSETS